MQLIKTKTNFYEQNTSSHLDYLAIHIDKSYRVDNLSIGEEMTKLIFQLHYDYSSYYDVQCCASSAEKLVTLFNTGTLEHVWSNFSKSCKL